LVVNVLGLQDTLEGITVLVDDPIKASRGGWVFDRPPPQAEKIRDLRELYDHLSPNNNYQGRCTAPLLVDWKTRQIVSNESKDIVRMLPLLLQAESSEKQQQQQQPEKNSKVSLDLCPGALASHIDETNEWVYRLLNNGVYRCGFSTSQEAYQGASTDVLEGLERCEELLKRQDYLCGDQLTESDLLLLPTMLRFDGVYSPLFGAGGKHLRLQCDYPSTFAWLQRCWKVEGVAESIDIEDACASYYRQLFPLNPGGILPTPVTAKSLRLE
jgi:putative glutathione S-transferase